MTAAPIMGRGRGGNPANYDMNDLLRRQQLAQQLYASSLQPQRPEQSWTQGAARLAQALVGSYMGSKANNQMQDRQQQYSQGMQSLGDALAHGGDISSTLSQLPPELQGQALGLIQQQVQNQQAQQQKQQDRQFEFQKIDYGNQSKTNADPFKSSQQQFGNIEDNMNALQSALSQEKDPQRQQAIQQQLDTLGATRDSYLQRLRNQKGEVPDLRKEYTNQALQSLQNGGGPNQAQMAALGTYGTPAPETAFQKGIGDVSAKMVGTRIEDLSNEAKAMQDLTSQGNEVMQIMAANPNVQSGFGRDSITKGQTFLNQLLPGLNINLGDQQAFQKAIGQMTLKGVGSLRGQGVQRITESEIQNVIPLFTPTIMNSREGLQKIIEINNAINPAIQKGNQAMMMLINQYNQNPRGVNLPSALNDLYRATQQEVQDSSLNYMNSELRQQGKQVVVNPQYDEIKSPFNKYQLVSLQANNQGDPGQPAPQAPMAPSAQMPPPQGAQAPQGVPVAAPQMPPQMQQQMQQPGNPQDAQKAALIQMLMKQQSGQ